MQVRTKTATPRPFAGGDLGANNYEMMSSSIPEHSTFFLYLLFLVPPQTHLANEQTYYNILTWFIVMHFGSLGVDLDFSLCENKPSKKEATSYKPINWFGLVNIYMCKKHSKNVRKLFFFIILHAVYFEAVKGAIKSEFGKKVKLIRTSPPL